MSRVVVVGAGLAGLMAAILLRRSGHHVTVVAKGLGGLQLSQGTIDILGRVEATVVDDPYEAMAGLPAEHPYHRIGAAAVREGVAALSELLPPTLMVVGNRNLMLPTAIGAWRPTFAAPASLVAGGFAPDRAAVIVGFAQLKDFPAELAAANLARTPLPGCDELTFPRVRSAVIDFAVRPGEIDTTGVAYARALDQAEHRSRLIEALRPVVSAGELIGLPAVLGLDDPTAWTQLSAAAGTELGCELFEISLQPPSVPGMRLNQALIARAKKDRVRWMLGATVTGLEGEPGQPVTAVTVRTAGGERRLAVDHVVHAPGGFESGALEVDSRLQIRETTFGLPLSATDATDLIHGDYWGAPQPLFGVGVTTDDDLRVTGADGAPVHPNLYAAGGILAGAIRWDEKSGEGIAVGSAVKLAAAIGTAREGSTAPDSVDAESVVTRYRRRSRP